MDEYIASEWIAGGSNGYKVHLSESAKQLCQPMRPSLITSEILRIATPLVNTPEAITKPG